jgi:hypothetical protein
LPKQKQQALSSFRIPSKPEMAKKSPPFPKIGSIRLGGEIRLSAADDSHSDRGLAPIILPERLVSSSTLTRDKGANVVLVQMPAQFDLEGDAGMVGRCISKAASDDTQQLPALDLKGIVYDLSAPLQLAGTSFVIKMTPAGKGSHPFWNV